VDAGSASIVAAMKVEDPRFRWEKYHVSG
jgi:hypothetical protein